MKNQKELIKLLHLKEEASWAEIYAEIGRLKEKASNSYDTPFIPYSVPMPLGTGNPDMYPYGYPTFTC